MAHSHLQQNFRDSFDRTASIYLPGRYGRRKCSKDDPRACRSDSSRGPSLDPLRIFLPTPPTWFYSR
ncbi:hypothetical protein I7I50_02757 [Histoplasma capsulatum G186AR]|uniref:Uncharacterized protein n=1 Tax=Ajellomyces capsulatus TaxID=5037 RepID=A0A8H7Z836_AJECA|nr:hypothetical protein I7I52_00577 [Histoplasma capsulatum]QSS71781.1 hypothetical protein I7I50_02757 [Histoplasma capsulatum G186AR]